MQSRIHLLISLCDNAAGRQHCLQSVEECADLFDSIYIVCDSGSPLGIKEGGKIRYLSQKESIETIASDDAFVFFLSSNDALCRKGIEELCALGTHKTDAVFGSQRRHFDDGSMKPYIARELFAFPQGVSPQQFAAMDMDKPHALALSGIMVHSTVLKRYSTLLGRTVAEKLLICNPWVKKIRQTIAPTVEIRGDNKVPLDDMEGYAMYASMQALLTDKKHMKRRYALALADAMPKSVGSTMTTLWKMLVFQSKVLFHVKNSDINYRGTAAFVTTLLTGLLKRERRRIKSFIKKMIYS